MAENRRTAAEIRRDIQAERDGLSRAVDQFRAGMAEATDVGSKLRANLPAAAGAALAAGFVLGGGIGATVRFIFRRGREGTQVARFGRFVVVEHDD
jgi:hypothetical protein